LVSKGVTSYGTPVLLNNKVDDADLIFTINSVEPHFFAGFTGGRKSIVPGLAAFSTVQTNHRLAKDEKSCALDLKNNPLHKDLHFFAGFTGGRKSIVPGLAAFSTVQTNHRLAKDEKSCALNLKNNPLHKDLEECLKLINDRPILTIQCVTDREGNIVDLGNLQESFLKACQCAAKYYTVDVPRKYDIVIANCEPPLDINLYQLQKAQEHGGRMVADGGVLITVGACKEGIGSEYFIRLTEKYPTPDLVLERGLDDASYGIHKLIKTARQLKKFKVFYVTALDEAVVKRVYLRPFNKIKEALNTALEEIGKNAEMAFLDDAGYTVPVIKL